MSIDSLRNSLVNSFYDNTTMLNVAMNIEYFLCEEVILYPYKNWFKGEIVSGPYIHRYNVSLILRYDYEDMPDPEGALVLKKFGVTCSYKKINEKVLDEEESDKQNKKVFVKKPVWYIIMNIPRNIISDENQQKQLDIIDELIDLEALENASDENMEEDSGFEMDNDFDTGFDDTPDMEPEVSDEPEEV